MLETALGKLFPNGEMEAITRSLLEDDMEPQSRVSGSSEDMLQDIIGDDARLPSLDALLPADGGMNQLSIPTGSVEDEKVLLDSYFQHYHTLNPFIHEATFKAEYAKQIPITHPNAWPILTNTILAIGAWTLHQSNTDKTYYSIAKQHLQQIPMFEQGNITMVQALLLLNDYAHKQGSPDESWQYMGTALRMAISLNLHSEEANSGFSSLDQEIRRRVWWTVYCFESCSTKIYGRPLLLPEDRLITVRPVSNVIDADTLIPTDSPTIYSGLIQQSSYHRMANNIYRRLLSSTIITGQDIHDLEQTINNWHDESPLCIQPNINPVPDWYTIARNRQMLCDRSLRLLIHRPLLLQWLEKRQLNITEHEYENERHCRVQGLDIARTTIDLITSLIMNGEYSRLTLSFTLYALFHALLVPVIHLKASPSSPTSISCIQDIDKVKRILPYFPIKEDALSLYFLVMLNRLCSIASRAGDERGPLKPGELRMSSNNIFGNEELAVLEREMRRKDEVDFSEWVEK
ncbi:hypothetical protein AWENTII_002993 [Aspergillus wentii]